MVVVVVVVGSTRFSGAFPSQLTQLVWTTFVTGHGIRSITHRYLDIIREDAETQYNLELPHHVTFQKPTALNQVVGSPGYLLKSSGSNPRTAVVATA